MVTIAHSPAGFSGKIDIRQFWPPPTPWTLAACPFESWAVPIDGERRKHARVSILIGAANWLIENGPKELEMLFRAIVFYPTAPVVLTDNDRHYREASIGASKLLGLPREKIIGHKLDDFTDPDFKPVISERWKTFLKDGEQVGTIPFVDAAGNPREVEYVAKGNVLPVRHVLVLRDKTPKATVPAWVQDYALFLLDVEGRIVAWYAGAERIYGYTSKEIVGQNAAAFLSRRRRCFEASGKIEARRGRRPRWHGRLACEEGWVPLLGQRHHHGSQGRERRPARLCPQSSATSPIAMKETKICAATARVSGRSRLNSPSRASFPANLTGFPRLTTRFSN